VHVYQLSYQVTHPTPDPRDTIGIGNAIDQMVSVDPGAGLWLSLVAGLLATAGGIALARRPDTVSPVFSIPVAPGSALPFATYAPPPERPRYQATPFSQFPAQPPARWPAAQVDPGPESPIRS
jgi:hypothetical protein